MADKKITDLQPIASVTDDINVPGDNGTQTYRVTAPQLFTYFRGKFPNMPNEIAGLQLASSVASNALTLAIKTNAGANPSAADKVRVSFRSATLTNGGFNTREIAAALSIVVPNAATLGQVSGQASRIWIYLIDNAGAVEVAVSHQLYRENELVTTLAIAGGTSATAIYSTTARTGVPVRLIGYVDNTQATAGVWLSAGTQLQLASGMIFKRPTQTYYSASGSGTYYKPAGCTRIEVEALAGGGGGGGGGTAGSTNGGTGGNSSFNSIVATGGSGGFSGGNGGVRAGGGSGGTGTASKRTPGGNGSNTISTSFQYGGGGGSSAYGGNGGFVPAGNNGDSGAANTGGGGSGGGGNSGVSGGGGGGAGELFVLNIDQPLASYAYTVGAGGSVGTAGTSGSTGGNGGTGFIMVREYYD